MKIFRAKLSQVLKRPAEALEKWRWLILAVIGLSLLWVETQEFLVLRVLNQAFHYLEVVQYAVLLTSTGVLIELFARSNRAHRQALKILEYKHRLNLELTASEDWEALLDKITRIPGEITTADEAYLLVENPLTGRFEKTAHWQAEEQSVNGYTWDPLKPCKHCLEKPTNGNGRFTIHLCRDSEKNPSFPQTYSLTMRDQSFPATVLKFKLKQGRHLSQEEEETLKNIGDEIIAALKANQDRKRLSEMQSAQIAMAERRFVSSFVHDQLGQNLGYIHLKLDQLHNDERTSLPKEIRSEMERLRDVANESYEIVRDILKKIQPETIPHLTNLLHEHARTVSRRAKFQLEFKTIGKASHLPTHTQQLIFFAFREILNNVEKHSRADKVQILVTWNERFLDICVADNGRGFDPSTVDNHEHFGLSIMRERIAAINGQLSINSSTETGTVVSLSVPLEAGKKVFS
jgi:nitrate/nitrite-specific signal transduction histidine kinase